MGRIIPYIMENKKCSKPPTRYSILMLIRHGVFRLLLPKENKKTARLFHPKKQTQTSIILGGAVPIIDGLVGGFKPSEKY